MDELALWVASCPDSVAECSSPEQVLAFWNNTPHPCLNGRCDDVCEQHPGAVQKLGPLVCERCGLVLAWLVSTGMTIAAAAEPSGGEGVMAA